MTSDVAHFSFLRQAIHPGIGTDCLYRWGRKFPTFSRWRFNIKPGHVLTELINSLVKDLSVSSRKHLTELKEKRYKMTPLVGKFGIFDRVVVPQNNGMEKC